jgi:hypothetical protein
MNNKSLQVKNQEMAIFKLITAIFLTMMLTGCHDNTIVPDNSIYNYFPTKVGSWVIYDVDSVRFNDFYKPVRVDTSTFQVLEKIESNFTDNEGRTAQRIEVYKRQTQEDNWTLDQVYYQVLTKSMAERVEENLRFIKLIFPPKTNISWKGNAYISYEDGWGCGFWGDWDYKYLDVDKPKKINSLQFDSTLTVFQVDDSNAICRSFGNECYAKNIGLVSKKFVRLWTDSIIPIVPFAARAKKGYILNYKIVAFGQD